MLEWFCMVGIFYPKEISMFINHKDSNLGQAPMFTGRLIESLLTSVEIQANKAKIEKLLNTDPFIFATPCWVSKKG